MADEQDQLVVSIDEGEDNTIAGDVEMAESAQTVEEQNGEDNASTNNDLPFAGEEPEQPTTFLSYLASPVVTLVVGKEEQTTLSAHQALLCKSPYFQEICDKFVEGAVSLIHKGDLLAHRLTDMIIGTAHRASRRRRPRRILLPRIPLHRRILPQENPRNTRTRRPPLHSQRRRQRRRAPQARARLHPRREVPDPCLAVARKLESTLRQCNGQGRDCVRSVCVQVHKPGRYNCQSTDRELLGY